MRIEPASPLGPRPTGRRVALYIDPPSHHFLGNRLFDPANASRAGDNIQAPFIAIRETLARDGIPVFTADLLPGIPDGSRNLYVSLGRLPDLRALAARPDVILSAFFAFECPIVEPRLYAALPMLQSRISRIFTFCDAGQLTPFTGTPIRTQRFVWPQCADDVDDKAWKRTDRKFLAMINANKLPRLYDRELYTERLRAVEFFHRFGEIDLYGPNWDRTPVRVGRGWIPRPVRRTQRWLLGRWRRLRPHPLYAAAAAASKGRAPSKSETLSRYTFALCFENMAMEGWITEKIFDCFFAGTVPIYLGAPDVLRWIPRETFVDMRDFDGYEALRDHLHGLGEADVQGYREAARRFVASPAFERFHVRAWVDRFRGFFRDDLGVDP
jgi:hypothetical protein